MASIRFLLTNEGQDEGRDESTGSNSEIANDADERHARAGSSRGGGCSGDSDDGNVEGTPAQRSSRHTGTVSDDEVLPRAETEAGSDRASGHYLAESVRRKNTCTQCDASFKRKQELTRHQLGVHERVRAFECKQCGKSFQQKSHLKEHINSVHDKKKDIMCTTCGSMFTTSSKMYRHMRSVHEGKRPFPCPECSRRYSQRTDLVRHIRAKHPHCTNYLTLDLTLIRST